MLLINQNNRKAVLLAQNNITMKLFKITLLLLAVLNSSALIAQTINTQTSKVTFSLSNLGLRTVEGTLTGMKGNISFNEADLSICTFDVCVDAATIDTDNQKRDNHLRKDDFFDVENYPSICFASESVSKTQNGYLAKGKLTMHGITKPFKIPFTFDGSTFVGNVELKRKDFGVGSGYNNFMVGNNVNVNITCSVE